MAQPTYTVDFALDANVAQAAREQRFRQFQTVEVPRLRQIGMALNAVGVLLHNYLLYGHVSMTDAVVIVGTLAGYAAFAWLLIHLFWARIRAFDIADFFLNFDILALAFVVYVSGANHSLLWPVFLARPADQVARTFKRAFYFAHLGPAVYLGLMLYVATVEHRDVVWAVEAAKALFLYFMGIYIALTARTAEARRNKLSEARRVAEQAVRTADERRRELESALAKLETASKAKSEFLANVSHELRTPLNSVLGTSDLLLDSPLSREQRDIVGVLRDSAESLTFVVNDILDLARVEARRMPMEQIPMRVREVAGATLRMFTARVHQRPVDLVCHIDRDVPDAVTGDPVRLRQVLTNLIGNAVKFTEQGEIVLRVALEELRGARVGLRFSVVDTGIGIPKDRQAAIFEAFTQVDGSSTRKYGGTGLGLTIANELVDLMGGRLWVESEPGHGSTFAFIAWFQRAGTEQTEAPWGAQPVRALVADSHASSQSALEEALAFWHGQEALDRLAAEQYDLVLMDLQMPVLDGLDATRRLREREAAAGLPRTPVIAMTARAMEEDRERCLAAGMNGFLSKPLDQRQLFDVLAGIAGPATGTVTPAPSAEDITSVISDPALVRHVAGLFLSTAPGQIERLSRALELGETAEAGSVAHALKGAADYFAGADVATLIEIEDLCRRGQVERAAALITQARADMEALAARLRAFLQ